MSVRVCFRVCRPHQPLVDELGRSPFAANARVAVNAFGSTIAETSKGGSTAPSFTSTSHHSGRNARGLDTSTRRRIQAYAEQCAQPGSPPSPLSLPLSLTAFQRREAHELAQDLGLHHESVGHDRATRRVVLSARP